ncbi:hypothetical protein DY000_02059051 [Brassica cretica]|uniref:Phosphoenolpyruvate carboxylase n=1 Tax=Brassica cretica TaxID=69181 RepID=A0ABQ7B1E5_BRACR|nr:hypothetical protein DY000_02059051 [Brassica cretica]
MGTRMLRLILKYPKLEVPVTDYIPLSRQDVQGISSDGYGPNLQIKTGNGNSVNSNGSQQTITPRGSSSSSPQLLLQKKLLADSQIGRTSFQKLLEPTPPKRAGIAPYRIVLGEVKEKLLKTRRLLELLLEGLPCEYDPWDYYETSDQLLEPLLLCYESLHSSDSGVLADGRLADLIRRVATFGMVLMKLDLRQEAAKHSEALDTITTYLDMGTYSEWDEEKKLEFLTRELKGKRPLIPPNIEVGPEVKEVLDTFRVAAELGSESLGAYVISMASDASDVLAVELLQKDARLAVSGDLGRPCPAGTLLKCRESNGLENVFCWYSPTKSYPEEKLLVETLLLCMVWSSTPLQNFGMVHCQDYRDVEAYRKRRRLWNGGPPTRVGGEPGGPSFSRWYCPVGSYYNRDKFEKI